MSRNGSGTYTLPAGNPVVTGTTISSTWANNTLTDIATALTGSLSADGQTPMTGALNMNSNKVTAVTDPTNAQDAATKNYTDAAITTATSGFGATYLAKANNLSDVASTSTSRTNLGLGTIATQAANSVAITGGSITGVSLNATDLSSGTVGYARLPTGSVLQVVNATYSTGVTSSSSTFADTGLTASITPKFSTSKILVLVNQTGCSKTVGNTTLGLKLLRNSTSIVTFEVDGGYTGTTATNYIGACTTSYLDSPATTSSITYKTQFNSTVNIAQTGVQSSGSTSTITLMEIAA